MQNMEIIQELKARGFDRVEILDGKACGISEQRLILCFISYEADDADASKKCRDAVIHAYYPVSQQAYRAAREFAERCREDGLQIRLANEIHIKRILNRLPFLRRGRNTLSFLPEAGSRFHVQILTSEEDLPVTAEMEAEEHQIACGSCRKCMEACPGHAITENGFERERCLRFWMMNGKMPPEETAERMGNRLLGCDDCEACCPMNRTGGSAEEEQTQGRAPATVPLKNLIEGDHHDALAEKIGRNYAIPNRVLTQACLIAGSLGRTDLTGALEKLQNQSASPAVREAAEWAVSRLKCEQKLNL